MNPLYSERSELSAGRPIQWMLSLFLGEKTARLTRGQAGRGMACALDVRDDRTNRDALRREFHIENGARAIVQSTPEGILLKPVSKRSHTDGCAICFLYSSNRPRDAHNCAPGARAR
jgi:hypothetical protein